MGTDCARFGRAAVGAALALLSVSTSVLALPQSSGSGPGLPGDGHILQQSGCPSPRPRVSVQTTALGDRRIQATVTAGSGALTLIRFGAMQQAHVELPSTGQRIDSNGELTPPSGAATVVFVAVGDAGQGGGAPAAITVPFTVFDGCGPGQPWTTFVGGGVTALQSQASVDDSEVTEGDTGTRQATFTVRLSAPSSQPVSVAYATSNGTATAGSDFAASSGAVTFNPGEVAKTVSAPVLGDVSPEADETFSVTLSNPVNATLGRSQATVRIVNDDISPMASGDSYVTTSGQVLSVGAGAGPPPGLLVNDQAGSQSAQVTSFGGLDAPGDVDTHASGSTAALGSGGSLKVLANGAFDFKPPSGFTGSFSFRYRAKSLVGISDATVIIDVRSPPNAVDDGNYAVIGAGPLSVAAGAGLLANDTRGAPIGAIVSFGGGSAGGAVTTNQAGATCDLGNGGSLTVNADGSFAFTAPPTVNGSFTFQYRLQNAAGADDATATISVRRGPSAASDSFTAVAGSGSLSGNVLTANPDVADDLGSPFATVTTFGGGSLSGSADTNAAGTMVALGAGGSLSVNADGALSFTPPTGFSGTFSFDYRITNAFGTSVGSVHILVARAPTAVADAFAVTVGSSDLTGDLTPPSGGGADNLGVPLATVTSVGGDSLGGTVTTYQTPASLSLAGGTLSVQPDGTLGLAGATMPGTYTFSYRLTNAGGTSDATVTITVQSAPTARNDAFQVMTGGSALTLPAGGLFADQGSGADDRAFPVAAITSFGGGSIGGTVDSRAAGAVITFGLGGSLTVGADGSMSFTPPVGFQGAFTFQYRLSNAAGSSVANVAITVTPPGSGGGGE